VVPIINVSALEGNNAEISTSCQYRPYQHSKAHIDGIKNF